MAGEVNPYDAVVASMPAPGANPYDAVLADLATTAPARASIAAAQGANPDVTARALAVSNRLGVPVDVAERNLSDFEAIERTNQYDQLLRTMPTTLKRWMAEPVNARVVGDDLPALAGQASLWRGLADVGRFAVAGFVDTPGTALEGLGYSADVLAGGFGSITGLRPKGQDKNLPWYLDPAELLKAGGKYFKDTAEMIRPPRERQNLADQVAEGVGQIGGQLLSLMATGGTGALLMLFGQGADQMADDVKKAGKMGTWEGDATLIGGGMLTAISEKLGLDLLVHRLSPAIKNKLARAVVDLAAAGGIEAAEEAHEQVGQNALSNYYLETHKSLLDGTLESAIPAGGAAAFVRAMLMGGGRLRRRQLPNPDRPEADAATLDRVMSTVRGTGLARRSPEKLAELLASLGDGGKVYVPAHAVRSLFQTIDPQDAQQQAHALGIDGQLEAAMATGGDVVIPLHRYVAHVSDETAAAWRDDLRLRPDGMSTSEATAFTEGATDFGDAVTSRLEETARQKAARDRVVATVERQLRDAGEPSEVARQIAQLYGERYATRAARLGQGDTVSQYGRSGVEFRSDKALADDFGRSKLEETWRAAGVDDFMSERDGVITLHKSVLPEGEGDQGKGTDALRELVDYADRTGQRIVLAPSADLGSDGSRLVDFYKSFGFVENRGGRRDEPMYRDAAHTYEQRDTFAADFMRELAAVDELFRYPIVKAWTPEDALHAIDPAIRFMGDATRADEHSESGADRRLMFRTERGHDFYLYEDGQQFWLNLSELVEGEQGSAIYAALFDYAATTGRQLIGDPVFLSDIALRRRTEAMLSSALKHGSTDHMEPHPRQLKGDEALGVPPLSWRAGDVRGNIQSLIDVSLASLSSKVPEFQRARYDFATRTFRTGEGKPLSDGALDRWVAGKGRDRKAGAGRATYKRGILLNTLVRAASGERPGLLERVLSRSRQQMGASLGGIFYQRRDAASVLGPLGSITVTREDAGRLKAVITLFKNRNRSTVLHETGHLWLEELHADAALPHAPQQLKADLATVRAYLGAGGDAPLTVEQHEKWARTVEAYFMEGKAPSAALEDVLARFKQWLLSIYRTAQGLNVEISDDVRGVLDRLIATDEAIAEAQAEVHARPFASAAQAGITEAEYHAYTESVAHSREVARRDVLAKLMSDARRRLTPQWKAEADALRKELQPGIDRQPDILALRYLRDGTLPDSLAHLRNLPRLRLSRAALIAEHGDPSIVTALPKSFLPMVSDKGGARPAEIAERLGFTDGRSMIDALTALAREQASLRKSGDKRSVRAKRTDDAVERAMLERHGPALVDGSIETEALSALHNDVRANVLAAEQRALARKAGKEATSYQLARDWARRKIAEKAFDEIGDLSWFTRAEARAAFAALEAQARGDAEGALRRKQEQMIAHALWTEARDAKARAEAARRREDRRADAWAPKEADESYLETIRIDATLATEASDGYNSYSAFKWKHKSAGLGYEWHHIVEQTTKNIEQFGATKIHNTNNIVRLPKGLHERVSHFYSTKQWFTDGLTVRKWLERQSFEDQATYGHNIIEKFRKESK